MEIWQVVVGVIGTVLVAFVGGFWSYFGGKKKGQTDFQVAVQSGFQNLVNELQEERAQLMQIVTAQAARIMNLEGEIRQLTQTVASLENLIVRNGLELPPET